MSVGFKIKRLREEKNLSQPELANLLDISQAKLSNIENGNTKSIDFKLMQKVCEYFEKTFDYFTENSSQINHIKELNSSVGVNNAGTVNLFPDIISQLKSMLDESRLKDEIISNLKAENEKLKKQ